MGTNYDQFWANKYNTGDFWRINNYNSNLTKTNTKTDSSIFNTNIQSSSNTKGDSFEKSEAQNIELDITDQSTEKYAGDLLNEKDSDYKASNAYDCKDVLEQNGVDLEGFTKMQNDKGETFYEKNNEDGSREWVRAVNKTNDDGTTEYKILHSFWDAETEEKTGKIYETKKDLTTAQKLENWENSHNDRINEYYPYLMDDNVDIDELTKAIEKNDNLLKNLGETFNFMDKNYDISTQEFADAYIEKTKELAEHEISGLDNSKDNTVSFEEFEAGELKDAGVEKFTQDESEYIKSVYDAIDINKDGKLSTNEYQGFYAALDNVDGSVDGKVNINSANPPENEGDRGFMSESFIKNISEFQQFFK